MPSAASHPTLVVWVEDKAVLKKKLAHRDGGRRASDLVEFAAVRLARLVVGAKEHEHDHCLANGQAKAQNRNSQDGHVPGTLHIVGTIFFDPSLVELESKLDENHYLNNQEEDAQNKRHPPETQEKLRGNKKHY